MKIDGIGSEPVYIAGKIINESNILASMPMSIASSPGIENNTTKHDIGISTEDDNEIIDTLAVDSDTPIGPEDCVFNIAQEDT